MRRRSLDTFVIGEEQLADEGGAAPLGVDDERVGCAGSPARALNSGVLPDSHRVVENNGFASDHAARGDRTVDGAERQPSTGRWQGTRWWRRLPGAPLVALSMAATVGVGVLIGAVALIGTRDRAKEESAAEESPGRTQIRHGGRAVRASGGAERRSHAGEKLAAPPSRVSAVKPDEGESQPATVASELAAPTSPAGTAVGPSSSVLPVATVPDQAPQQANAAAVYQEFGP